MFIEPSCVGPPVGDEPLDAIIEEDVCDGLVWVWHEVDLACHYPTLPTQWDVEVGAMLEREEPAYLPMVLVGYYDLEFDPGSVIIACNGQQSSYEAHHHGLPLWIIHTEQSDIRVIIIEGVINLGQMRY